MQKPDLLNSYQLLMRQSRKMGRAAARSLDVTKKFLTQDVPAPPPGRKPFNVFDRTAAKKTSDANLKKVVAESHEILVRARTVVLPNNLFSDSVVVDRTKVTITKSNFFWNAEVISIRIEDVLNVSTNAGPLFGSLTIASRVMSSTDHFTINYFWRKDAERLKCILQGYVIALHNKIDVQDLTLYELIDTLTDLGHD